MMIAIKIDQLSVDQRRVFMELMQAGLTLHYTFHLARQELIKHH